MYTSEHAHQQAHQFLLYLKTVCYVNILKPYQNMTTVYLT